MKNYTLLRTLILLFVSTSLSAQSPFELNLKVGQSGSTFDAMLTNISETPQVVRRSGRGANDQNLSFVIVDLVGDSSFVCPPVANTENYTRNLSPGDSLLFHITLESSEVPAGGSYSVQLIYHSIFRKHNQLPENSPLRRAYQGEVFSNTLFVN